jgi:hypothetical protein
VQFGALQQPQAPSGNGSSSGSSSSSGARPLKGWEKYPGFLEVTLAAKPRPAPEVLLVVTDPAAGVRPDVPAGYGSGFEHGEWCCSSCKQLSCGCRLYSKIAVLGLRLSKEYPVAWVRPDVPAGYGSGFEHSEWCGYGCCK